MILHLMRNLLILMNKLFDNKFWYLGYTSTQLGNKDYDKAFCLIVRNPFDKSWKKWAEAKSFHKKKHEERMLDEEYQKAYEEYRQAFNNAIDKTEGGFTKSLL